MIKTILFLLFILYNSFTYCQIDSINNEPKDQEELPICSATSLDGKILLKSYSEDYSGSFKINSTFIRYKLDNKTVEGMIADYFKFDIPSNVKESSFCKIITLDSSKFIYLAIGGGTACNTCLWDIALQIQILKDTIKMTIPFEIAYRYTNNNRVVFMYDNEKKIFLYKYRINKDDTLYGYKCEEETKTKNGDCIISKRFKFNGENFEEDK